MFKRKIDLFLEEWKNRTHKPLIITGLKGCGKTTAVKKFCERYQSFVYINAKDCARHNIVFNSLPDDTLVFFDDVQNCSDIGGFLKYFEDSERYDAIFASDHHLMTDGDYIENYRMYSMDFEEFLWANGYSKEHVEHLYSYLRDLKPLSVATMKQMGRLFRNYILIGGMPDIVQGFIDSGVFSSISAKQKKCYELLTNEIIENFGIRTDRLYRNLTGQLAKHNHKFQYTKLSHGARARDYNGCTERLMDAGIINIAYNLNDLSLPLAGNEDNSNFRIYYGDNGLFMAGLDEEAKTEILQNGNYEIYNGALYESIVCEVLVKQGYTPYFYRKEDSTFELDFVLRVKNEIVPIEVKKKKGRTRSLNTVIESEECIKHGIKLSMNDIGFDGKIITLPYFMTFLLKRFLKESDIFED